MGELGVITADPILVGLVVGIPTSALGYLGYRRSAKLDRVAAASAGLALRSAEAKVVSEGQTDLISNLQTDNKELRVLVGDLRKEIRGLYVEIENLGRKVDALKAGG